MGTQGTALPNMPSISIGASAEEVAQYWAALQNCNRDFLVLLVDQGPVVVPGFLFSSKSGTPRDMNVFRKRKMGESLKSLEIPQAGFHAFRHFNVALMDALRVPLKTIQERIGHSLTGSFTLDVYGGKPDWEPNREAARLIAAEIEKAVSEVAAKTKAAVVGSLSAIGGEIDSISSCKSLN